MSVGGGGIIYAADMNRALGGGPERSVCIVRNSAVLAVPSGTVVTAMPWDTEDLDTDGWHSTSSNTSRITPLKAGWVECKSVIHFASNANGRRAAVFKKNGGTAYYGEIKAASIASPVSAINVREFQVNGTTDYIEVFPFQDSAVTINTHTDFIGTYFSVTWLRE